MLLPTIDKNKGFSLVETLMAISILSISIVATFTAVQTGIQNSTVARDQTTAFYLAQEAMEYVKNTRDQNGLYSIKNPDTPIDWLAGLHTPGDPCELGNVCSIDSPLVTVASCGTASITTTSPGVCPNIKQDTVTGLFGYTAAWPDTNFKREVQMQMISPYEVEVVVSISWMSKNGMKYFQAREILLNHQ